jgi:hypothetical protein
MSHSKIHGNGFEWSIDEVDYVFGQPEGPSPLWGGRVASKEDANASFSKVDIYWLYDRGIGLKLTLSSKNFTDFMYAESMSLLSEYHRPGNAVIVTRDELAERIRNDFPFYKVELSAVRDIKEEEDLNSAIQTGLYDTIVLPLVSNDNYTMLKNIKDKKQIRLFTNAECSYSCPNKVCYGTISQINNEKKDKMMCSHYDLKLPRLFYNDDIKWDEYYFNINGLKSMGFENFKVIASVEYQTRSHILYGDTELAKEILSK